MMSHFVTDVARKRGVARNCCAYAAPNPWVLRLSLLMMTVVVGPYCSLCFLLPLAAGYKRNASLATLWLVAVLA
jgi:hypothetical protein